MTLDVFEKNVINIIEGIENQGSIKMMGTQNGTGNIPVVISLAEPSLGPTACADVISVNLGFDWDAGKFIIFPSEDLIRKDNSNNSTTKMQSGSVYSCSWCNCVVKQGDRYCHSCGKKFKKL